MRFLAFHPQAECCEPEGQDEPVGSSRLVPRYRTADSHATVSSVGYLRPVMSLWQRCGYHSVTQRCSRVTAGLSSIQCDEAWRCVACLWRGCARSAGLGWATQRLGKFPSSPVVCVYTFTINMAIQIGQFPSVWRWASL